jgi:hypothetical protein
MVTIRWGEQDFLGYAMVNGTTNQWKSESGRKVGHGQLLIHHGAESVVRKDSSL